MDSIRRKHILIVEDEQPLAFGLKKRLEMAGFDVHAELKGQPALEYVVGHQVDLVILDVNLPDVNGYQVARQVRKFYHPWAVPILMLTINDKPIDQLRGFAHGADAYLTKPFHTNELLAAVSTLCGEPPAVLDAEADDVELP